MTESVAVVVVTYNRAELLVRCLEGLAALERRPDAVYVVDNASTDHTPEVLAAQEDEGPLPLRVLALSVAGSLAFAWAARRVWLRSIARYTSASS